MVAWMVGDAPIVGQTSPSVLTNALIKQDYVSLNEYPATVLSMNAEQDTFPSEMRKRCLIIYTGASLPDHTGKSRKLAQTVRRLKRKLGTAFYREYLRCVLEKLPQGVPQDVLQFSSGILCQLFAEYSQTPLPACCQPMNMTDYSSTKHDKIKKELLQLWQFNQDAWQIKAHPKQF